MTTSTDCRSRHDETKLSIVIWRAASDLVLNTLNHPPTEAN